MFKSLSIRQKFFGFGGLMAAVALIIGAIGYWGISRQSQRARRAWSSPRSRCATTWKAT